MKQLTLPIDELCAHEMESVLYEQHYDSGIDWANKATFSSSRFAQFYMDQWYALEFDPYVYTSIMAMCDPELLLACSNGHRWLQLWLPLGDILPMPRTLEEVEQKLRIYEEFNRLRERVGLPSRNYQEPWQNSRVRESSNPSIRSSSKPSLQSLWSKYSVQIKPKHPLE